MEMEFYLYADGEPIAKFKYEPDRDTCLMALEDKHKDILFTT